MLLYKKNYSDDVTLLINMMSYYSTKSPKLSDSELKIEKLKL
jgi:hypothetical protein